MHKLDNKIPPPLVTLTFAIIVWQSAAFLPRVSVPSDIRLGLSILFIFTAMFFCIAGVISFKRARTTVNPLKPETASALVSSGIYRISRNPMYVGFAFALAALCIYLLSPLTIIGLAGFIAYMNTFQIQPEERALKKLFGDDFLSYQARVRRWL